MTTELTEKLNQLAQLANEIGAEGVWLFRGVKDAYLTYTPNEPVKVDTPLISANLSIRFGIADTGVLLIMRFPDDGGQHGVEYK
ncbi:MAG: hypothetical protein HC875_16940 [Anaerolineales bacterium]|nr:hypothetical protein [Anaerolineales bacterium]